MRNQPDFSILFDGSGGIVLQTPDYCHFYNGCEAQAAEDVCNLLSGGSSDDWDQDGNEPESRFDADNPMAFAPDDIRLILKETNRELFLEGVSDQAERAFLRHIFKLNDNTEREQ